VGLRAALALAIALDLDATLAVGSRPGIELAARVDEADAITRLAAVALATDEESLVPSLLRLGVGAARVDGVRRASRLARLLGRDEDGAAIDPVAVYDSGRDAARRAAALLRASGRGGRATALAQVIERDGGAIFEIRPLLDGREIGSATGPAPGPWIGELRRALLVAQLRGEVRDATEARALVRAIAAR
jgi:hypothetical protein